MQRCTAHRDKAVKNVRIATFLIFSVTKDTETDEDAFTSKHHCCYNHPSPQVVASFAANACKSEAEQLQGKNYRMLPFLHSFYKLATNKILNADETQIPGVANVFYYWLTNHVRNCLNSDTEINKTNILDLTNILKVLIPNHYNGKASLLAL